ncbi:YitT family protein [Paenibacillus sedimenti]|uniref:YitT family protein n=1 Tax=Paenibacillus sedimenti TaxID=2770274 RepID=A0A926KW74_9BACL|nr:YitT family protein [Paenibacillus sedimenti]MBD0384021.1 YitT family protein [Paenibacillus sedimenti]
MRKCMFILLGCMLTAIGLIVLKHTHAVTGGTAGLALSLSYLFHFPFVAAFLALNIPFFLFSAMTMGWRFTLYSIGSVITLTLMTALMEHMLPPFVPSDLIAAVLGGISIGFGVSLLFMNGSSLGGAHILALYLQRKLNWDPGKVNFAIDCLVVLISLSTAGLLKGMYSILSIAITSIIMSYWKNKIKTRNTKKDGKSPQTARVTSTAKPSFQ